MGSLPQPEDRAMAQPDQEPSEDYGYGLVHEIPAADVDGQVHRAHRPHHVLEHPTGRAGTEPDGDFGYDEAHDL